MSDSGTPDKAITVAYWQPFSITESPGANAYQKPLGLSRLGKLFMLCPEEATLPEEVKALATIVRAGRRCLTRWPQRIINLPTTIRALRRLARSEPIDVVCTHIEPPSLLLGWWARRRLGCRWVAFCWDHPFAGLDAEPRTWMARVTLALLWRFSGWLARQADLVVCNIVPDVLAPMRLDPARIAAFPNGVLVDRLYGIAAGVTPRAGLVGVVANVSAKKGTCYAVRMLAEIRQHVPSARLRLVGEVDPDPEGKLSRTIEALNLHDHVEMTGWQPYDQAMRLAADCQVLIHCYPNLPCFRNNHVLKINEYLALGRPVVAISVPGTRAIIREGENGFLAPEDNPVAAGKSVARLLTDTALWRSMSAAACVSAEALNWRGISGDINASIREIAASWHGTRATTREREHGRVERLAVPKRVSLPRRISVVRRNIPARVVFSRHELRMRIGRILHRCRITDLFFHLNRNRKRIVSYHGVLPDTMLHGGLRDGMAVSQSVFEAQVRYLNSRFRCGLNLDDPRELAITFDDGHASQHVVAHHVLAQLGLRAFFFCTLGFVQEGRPLLIDLLHLWVGLVKPGTYDIRLPGEATIRAIIEGEADRSRCWSRLYSHLLCGNPLHIGPALYAALDRCYSFELLRGRVGVAEYELRYAPISAAGLADMKAYGHAIGAHGASHWPLAILDAETRDREIARCAAEVGKTYNTSVLAYPFGGEKEVSHDVIACARRRGFTRCLANINRPLSSGRAYTAAFIPRLSLGEAATTADMAFILSGAEYFLRYRKLLPTWNEHAD